MIDITEINTIANTLPDAEWNVLMTDRGEVQKKLNVFLFL